MNTPMSRDLLADPKPRLNRRIQTEVLARMAPGERLRQALELSEFTRGLFRHGLRARFPALPEADLHRLYLDRLAKCHNRNY
ncbi:MAG: hypothetical protein AAB152_01400 [Candidatus Coatesbacteria bacterium]|mgnify:CR=1 FL=1